jgi:BirA family transcriptional regulator, biotin operon repressor / biotin---[acetyl-CoA-carboxylase] ligase
MFIIKLNAIGSTNSFLKEYVREHPVENYTTVVAERQTQGRGQMGTQWETETGKNLTFSIFIKTENQNTQYIFDLNCVVTTSIFKVLTTYKLPDLSIKWPNDILSDSKKIAGILIENSFKSNTQIESIIGIGINVNQKYFNNIPNATSIYNILGTELDKDTLLNDILLEIKTNFTLYQNQGADSLWIYFHDNLYKKNIPSLFLNTVTQQQFIGTIQKVNQNGLLVVKMEDQSLHTFGIKEISLIT